MAEIRLTSEITVRLIQSCGGDHVVVAAAKVSTSGEEAAKLARTACPIHTPDMEEWAGCDLCEPFRKQAEAGRGLIRYLMQNRHGTPFEHSFLSFFVHAPIFVWREWHRHRIGHSFNEESARYKTLDPVFYVPPRDRAMMKADGWKPGRPKFLPCEDDEVYARLCSNLVESYELAYANYLENLSLGIDPGLARDCLPVGIYSSCWVSVNPRSLMAFLSLRTHEPSARHVSYPLYEIDVAARECEKALRDGWPITHEAFNEFGRVAP